MIGVVPAVVLTVLIYALAFFPLVGCPKASAPLAVLEHRTVASHCDGGVRVLDYTDEAGQSVATVLVWHGCAP